MQNAQFIKYITFSSEIFWEDWEDPRIYEWDRLGFLKLRKNGTITGLKKTHVQISFLYSIEVCLQTNHAIFRPFSLLDYTWIHCLLKSILMVANQFDWSVDLLGKEE